jgi:hypothetical protein
MNSRAVNLIDFEEFFSSVKISLSASTMDLSSSGLIKRKSSCVMRRPVKPRACMRMKLGPISCAYGDHESVFCFLLGEAEVSVVDERGCDILIQSIRQHILSTHRGVDNRPELCRD